MTGGGDSRGRWDRFWYGDGPLVRLAAFRIIVLAAALYAVFQFRRSVFQHAEGGSDFVARHWNPIFAFELLGFEGLGATAAEVVYAVLLVALALGLVGLFTRVACAVVAVLLVVWIGTAYSWGKPHHDCIVLVFAVASLPLGPVGGRLSLDAVRARWRRAARGGDPSEAPKTAPYAHLPLRITQLTAALGYFFAGASKLAIGGLSWANGYTLQGIMLEFDAPWGEFFAASPGVCRFLSTGMLVVQVAFPLAIFWRPSRWFFLPMGVVFHLMTWKTMATSPFLTLWFCLAAFVHLERAPAFLRERIAEGAVARRVAWALAVLLGAALVVRLYFAFLPLALALALVPLALGALLGLRRSLTLSVVFDGGCGPCRRTASLLAAMDWAGHLRLLDLTQWDVVSARHPELDPDACLRDMHAVDARGRVTAGYRAYQQIAWRVPLLLLAAPWMYLPPIAAVGTRIYRRVADGRLRGTCDPSSGAGAP